jgi:thiol-disulfide isomerase/thioredoxin
MDNITSNLNKNNFKIVNGKAQIKSMNINGKQYKWDKPGILLIHAHWCGHCVSFKPKYQQISQLLNKNGIYYPCVAIESEEITNDLQTSLNFKGYPTMKYIDNFGNVQGDESSRDISQIIGNICTRSCKSGNCFESCKSI